MLQNLYRLIPQSNLFSWLDAEHRQVTELALEAETRVRQLNGLTPNPTEAELVSILQSICLLLQRLQRLERQLAKPPLDSTKIADEVESVSIETPELSPTLYELIKLRDWLLLAQKNQPENEVKVLSAIDYELGKILQGEGVMTIEETGVFNCDRQKIIATKITNDSQKSDRICYTVRPGYLFKDELIRPQEAIVYLYQKSYNA